MSWLTDLLGKNYTKLTDQDIAADMLKDSKFSLNALAAAVPETSNPELRQILKQNLNNALKAHFRLSDIAINNAWYRPNLAPQDQLRRDYASSIDITTEE